MRCSRYASKSSSVEGAIAVDQEEVVQPAVIILALNSLKCPLEIVGYFMGLAQSSHSTAGAVILGISQNLRIWWTLPIEALLQ